MEVFPLISAIPADNPLVEQINFKNIGVSFGKEARERKKQQWDYPKRDVALKYTWLSKADALTIWNFYIARGGSFGSFRYIHPFQNIYEREFVAISPGNLSTFELPSVGAINYTLYLDNVPLNEGSDYAFFSEGSSEGIDYFEVYPPDVGSIFTWSFTGQLVQRCRFDDDSFSYDTFYDRLSKMGVKLKGLLYSDQFSFAEIDPIFHFNEFDDESIDPRWTEQLRCTEGADGRMLIGDPPTGGGRLGQEDLVLRSQFFDIWTKFSDFYKLAGFDAEYAIKLLWNPSNPNVELGIKWDESAGTWYIYLEATSAAPAFSETEVDIGASLPSEVWLRLKYQFGDSYVRAYWSLKYPAELDDWTEITTSPNHCTPLDILVDIYFQTSGSSADRSYKMQFFRDTFLHPGTTSTTTTTT
jgi:hypothetical protein